ncbi:rab-type small G protein, partial [Ochromonadaceae sp. CCMP2298]
MSKKAPTDMQFKLLTIGDSEVGKTCLIQRFACDRFSANTINTIGVDFKLKNVKLGEDRVKLQIWDTAGQERFRSISVSFFRGAHGILLVYDVTDKSSFRSVRDWMKQIKENCDDDVLVVLVGNKCDLDSERLVPFEEGRKLAEEFRMNFYETSAKCGTNVADCFVDMALAMKLRLL